MLQPVASWGDRGPHGCNRSLGGRAVKGRTCSSRYGEGDQPKANGGDGTESGAAPPPRYARFPSPYRGGISEKEIGARWDLPSPHCASVGLGAEPVLRPQDSPCHARRSRHSTSHPSREPVSTPIGVVSTRWLAQQRWDRPTDPSGLVITSVSSSSRSTRSTYSPLAPVRTRRSPVSTQVPPPPV